jgi:hypothetical protein
LLSSAAHHNDASTCNRILYFLAIFAISSIESKAHNTVVPAVAFIKNGVYPRYISSLICFSNIFVSILPCLSLFIILKLLFPIPTKFAALGKE